MDMADEFSTQLYKALCSDRDDEVLDLCSKSADGPLHVLTLHNDTVLDTALYLKKIQLANELFDQLPVNSLSRLLNHRNDWGNTLLQNAATSNEGVELCRKLLQKAPQLLLARNMWGETAVFQAARYSKTRMFEFLADGVDDFLRNGEGKGFDQLHFFQRDDKTTILHMSILAGNFDMALIIAKRYPHLCNLQTQKGITALQILACNPTTFASGTKRGFIKEFIYKRVATSEGQTLGDKPARSSSTLHKASSFILKFGILRCISPMIEAIREEKKGHQDALNLAKILVRIDTSWKYSYKPGVDETPNIMGDASKIRVSIGGDTSTGPPLVRRGGEASLLEVVVEEPNSGDDSASSFNEPEDDKIKSSSADYRNSISDSDETPLLLAARKGCIEIVKEILDVYPQAVEFLNRDGHSLLHLAVKYRNLNVVELLKERQLHLRSLVRWLDRKGNSILHMVVSKKETFVDAKMRSPALQLSKDLLLLEDMKELCPSYLLHHHNDQMMTADELFIMNNKQLRNDAKEWLQRTAEHCTVVIILIATVAFAAAYTVPGGPNQDTGFPLLIGKPFFLVFTLTDVISLAFALTAVVIFLAILTSSFHFKDFRRSLPHKLLLGFTLLFLSVSMMMVSFAATIILMINNKDHWAKTSVYAVAFFPVSIFVLSYIPLYVQLVKSFLYYLKKFSKFVPRPSCVMGRTRLSRSYRDQCRSTGWAADKASI